MGVVVKGRCRGSSDLYRDVYVLGFGDPRDIRGQTCGLSIVVDIMS